MTEIFLKHDFKPIFDFNRSCNLGSKWMRLEDGNTLRQFGRMIKSKLSTTF